MIILWKVCAGLAIFTFIMFLCVLTTTTFANNFTQSPKRENIVTWNARFNFLKVLGWQYTIYVFAAASLISLISSLGIFA